MYLYTLKPNFLPKEPIGEFISAIWTERYSSAGDVQLVTPATPEMIQKLAHGTRLGLRGTKEIMLLDTHSIEDGLLTVTGQSLLKFLDERPAYFENPDASSEQHTAALTQDTKAGLLIAFAVNRMVITPIPFEDSSVPFNLDWAREVIPGLDLGYVDDNGSVKRLTVNLGALYSSIQSLAEEEGLGLKLYLESSKSSTGPVFRFAVYRGKNRTSEQSTHTIVRLTPKMDSLAEVKEVSSSAAYKNVVYVVYQGVTTHYAEPTLPIPVGFERRALVVQADDIYLEPERYDEYRNQVARDAFANNNYVHAVDGQAAPEGIYQYGVDYGLGDIIELEGITGILAKARVTEYIRTQDKVGEREYPTLSVVDHLSTGTIPDTEPDPIEPPGEGDPDYDDDVPDPPEEWPEEPPEQPPDEEPEVPPPGDPPPDGDPDEPTYEGPNPDREPYTAPSTSSGIEVTDTFPPNGFNGSYTDDYYSVTMRSNIRATIHVPEAPPGGWHDVKYLGPVFKINFGDLADLPPYTAEWPTDPPEPLGHFSNEYEEGSAEPIGISFQVHRQWFMKTLALAPLFSIPKWPSTRLVSIQHWTSGDIIWYPALGGDPVTTQWNTFPEDGDVTLEFQWIMYGWSQWGIGPNGWIAL
jgi:hypothetical protein